LILFGWRRLTHILGSKLDECLKCGTIGQHLLVRKSYWFSLFFVPVLLLRLKHGMVCTNCGEWTGVPMLKMIRGTQSGRLPLERVRPKFAAVEPDQWGRKPTAAEVLDPIVHNDKPGLLSVYVRVWPALAAVVIMAIITVSVLFPAPKTPMGQTINRDLQTKYGKAHDCWDTGATVKGCRLQSGALVGTQTGTQTICYFNEPLADVDQNLMCDN
jgi:hypothetical protein